jgi:hypothetical protein
VGFVAFGEDIPIQNEDGTFETIRIGLYYRIQKFDILDANQQTNVVRARKVMSKIFELAEVLDAVPSDVTAHNLDKYPRQI